MMICNKHEKEIVIQNEVYHKLLSCPLVPPETGGILGEVNGIISKAIMIPNESNNKGVFSPDIFFLNDILDSWYKEGVVFAGMFHTHADNWESLSKADVQYIEKIMQTLKEHTTQLFFPLVFPKKRIDGYRAFYMDSAIHIEKTTINILSGR